MASASHQPSHRREPAYAQQQRQLPYALTIRRSAAGLGVYAEEDIPAGAFVCEYTGEVLSDAQADDRVSKYLIDAEDGWVIDGAGRENFARYINHRCRPNCEAVADGHRVFIYTTRRIRPGEELGYNYGKGYVERYFHGECQCQTCRNRRKQ